jgi:hypothetical protein
MLRALAISKCRRQPLHEKRASSQNENKLTMGRDWGRTIARMVGGGQWGKRTVSIEMLPDGNPTDVVAGNMNAGIQRQRVTCGVSMIVWTKDYLAVARVGFNRRWVGQAVQRYADDNKNQQPCHASDSHNILNLWPDNEPNTTLRQSREYFKWSRLHGRIYPRGGQFQVRELRRIWLRLLSTALEQTSEHLNLLKSLKRTANPFLKLD